MDDEKIIFELMHFTQATGDGMKSYFDTLISNSEDWCPFSHGEEVDINCYLLNPNIIYLLNILEKYLLIFDFLDLDSFNLKKLDNHISKLKDPRNNSNYYEFLENVNNIKEIIDFYSEKINDKLQKISCQELIRLDESINGFKNHLFYSSVVMAVSAVESRLHSLFRHKDSSLYNEFENATIGKLLSVFRDGEYIDSRYDELKTILPKKHKSLVELLNYLRVYSAHPKDKKITYKDSQSAINLSFNFLLDEDLQIHKEDLRTCT